MKKPPISPHDSLQTPFVGDIAYAEKSLPDLLRLVQQQADLLAKQDQEIQLKNNEIKRILPLEAEIKRLIPLEAEVLRLKDIEIAHDRLKLLLSHHQRMRFGIKSERFNEQQRDLFAEDWQADDGDLQQQLQTVLPSPKTPRVRAGRQALAAHLPRIDIRHQPAACTCGQCGQALQLLREETVEKLDIIPCQFQVIRHIYPQMTCRHCELMVAEPSVPSVIDGGVATARLLAWVMVSKFVDHLPLYRLEHIAARQQVPFPRSTLADWVGRIGFILQPLVDRLRVRLHQHRVMHADETPIRQLDPKAKTGSTKTAYLWAYRSHALSNQAPMVVFDYQTSRAGHHARDFLQDWQGYLVVDDYAGYKALFRNGVIEVGCWAHVRRKFMDLHVANQSPMAAEALRRIAQLYEIERRVAAMTMDERQALRQLESLPALASLFDWLTEQTHQVAPNSGMAKALAYALRRWSALCVYASRGDLPMDNNPVENSIRPIAVGKKNWLFAGSERAGKRAAAIQSLLATAKLNGLEPLAWLTDTLEKLPTWPNSRLDELLPLKKIQQNLCQ